MPVGVYRYSFENSSLGYRVWWTDHILERQVAFTGAAAEGRVALQITVSPGDGGLQCDHPCQRAEIRQHSRYQPLYGEEVWQSFSFRMSGDIPTSHSLRFVIGQWKGPADGSPFLAQRFDDGVFHITVEDGLIRRPVASARGNPARLAAFQAKLLELGADPKFGPATLQAASALANLKALQNAPGFVAARNVNRPLRTRLVDAAKGLAKSRAGPLERLFDEFSFIKELERYIQPAAISVENPNNLNLPDPKLGWVRMMYRIRGGRRDNDLFGPNQEGQVDIYANGDLIAKVRGDLGPRLTERPRDPNMYFQCGIYRYLTGGTVRFHFDDFRQGVRESDVG